MKNLIIIGARGFGREVYNLATETNGYGVDFIVKGFLDDDFKVLIGYEGYPQILSEVETYIVESDDVFICALGDVKYKRKYTQLILEKGGHFISLVHPSASISKNTKIGIGCIVCRNVEISCDVKIGDFVTLLFSAVCGHDVEIGDWSHIGCHAMCAGFVRVGSMATIHTGAIIHPRKEVGCNATVGAGSVVIRKVKEHVTVFGIPAIEI